jgi:DNA invertase Pin-like site-specific DNA recombinase
VPLDDLREDPAMKIGYARVSSSGQSLDVQLEALEAAGCAKIYREKQSGRTTDGRPELDKALDQLRPGDELAVTRLDRLARSVPDLYAIVKRIDEAGASFACLQQGGIETASATGKLMLGVLGAVAEFERELLLERQREGIARAKARGAYGGRKASIDKVKVEEAIGRLGPAGAAAELGIARSSIYRIVTPDRIAELRAAREKVEQPT